MNEVNITPPNLGLQHRPRRGFFGWMCREVLRF